jgi:hypothetical protein
MVGDDVVGGRRQRWEDYGGRAEALLRILMQISAYCRWIKLGRPQESLFRLLLGPDKLTADNAPTEVLPSLCLLP